MDAKFWPHTVGNKKIPLLVFKKGLYFWYISCRKKIKKVYTEQYLFHCLNSLNNNFSRKWAQWNIIFTGIDDYFSKLSDLAQVW